MYLRVPATIVCSRFFDILLFSNFTAAEMRRAGDFGLKIAIFCQKWPFWSISAAVKLEKKQNTKKAGAYDCSWDQGTFIPGFRPIESFPTD